MKEEILSIASDLREGSMTTNEACKQLLCLLEPEQREVSEKEFISSDAFADELSVWKEKDYALKIKLREAVEFAEWCVINANPIFPNKGQWKDKLGFEFTTQELFDLFKSKSTNVKGFPFTACEEVEWGDKEEIDLDNPKYNDPNDPDSFTTYEGCNP
jgi:hypothetical protein